MEPHGLKPVVPENILLRPNFFSLLRSNVFTLELRRTDSSEAKRESNLAKENHVRASQQLSASKISFATGRNRAEAKSFSHSSPDFSPGSSRLWRLRRRINLGADSVRLILFLAFKEFIFNTVRQCFPACFNNVFMDANGCP